LCFWFSVVIVATSGLQQLNVNITVELVERDSVKTVQTILCQFLTGGGWIQFECVIAATRKVNSFIAAYLRVFFELLIVIQLVQKFS
jgi:hypothetical protein